MEKEPPLQRPATGRSDTDRVGPDSYRYRYRQKPDADTRAPIRLSSITRTVVLASVAFAAILLYLVRDMGLDASQLLGYAQAAVIFVGTFLVAGTLLGGVVVLVRTLLAKGAKEPKGPKEATPEDRRAINAAGSESVPDEVQTPGRSPD